MKVSGSQLIIETLKTEGISHIFGVSGSTTLSLLDVIYHEPQIRYIQTQHEQNAMYMANGYSRATRTAGVCLVSPGPGISNCLSGVGQAFYTSTPSVLIGIEYDTASYGLGSSVHHDLDAVSIFKPVTKYAVRVDLVSRVVESLQMAFRTALSGRKGPVYLGIAKNILTDKLEIEDRKPKRSPVEFAHPADPGSISKACDLLAAAERPVALAGGGVFWSQAQDVLLEVAGRLAMPVGTSGHHKGLIPEDHPLAIGPVSQHSTPMGLRTAQEADLLIALGCTFNNFLTRKFGHQVVRKGVKIIQVDIDPVEIGKIFSTDVGILGDARSVLNDMFRNINEKNIDRRPAEKSPRIAALLKMKKEWQASILPQKTSDKVPIQRFRLLHDLRQALPRDAIVAGASGGTNGWYEFGFEALAHNYGIGGWHPLGAEYPESLGVKTALPDRIVVCLTGDGSIMMTVQELATAVANDISLLCVVCHNGVFGNMHHTQIKRFGGRFIGTELHIPNLANIAREFGAYGERVKDPGEIIPAIGRALESGKPALLEVMMDASPENLVNPNLAAQF